MWASGILAHKCDIVLGGRKVGFHLLFVNLCRFVRVMWALISDFIILLEIPRNRENTNTILALYLIAYVTIIALGLFEVPLCWYNWRFFFYHFWEYVLSLPKLACYH